MNNVENICIVGLGRQGNDHLEASSELLEMGIIKNIYVYDIDFEYVSKMEKSFNFKKLKNLNNKFKKPTLFVLCVPNDAHEKIIAKINQINPKSYILKEKPLFKNTYSENINIAQQRFFNRSYIFAKNNLNLIGDIKYFDYQYTLNDNKESWYWDNKRGGGCFLNVGWHFAFLITWFFGKPKEIKVNKMKTNRKSFEYNTDDTVFINVGYEEYFGKSYLSVADTSKRDSFRIIGEKGTLEVNKKECLIHNNSNSLIKKKKGNETLSYMKQLWTVCKNDSKKLKELKNINKEVGAIIKNN